MRTYLLLAAMALGFGWNGVSLAHGTESGAMMKAPHSTITFGSGSSALTDTDRASLRKMVQDARSHGDITAIHVAAWSDKALPRVGHKLLDTDRDLAANRADAIKDYLKTVMDVATVDTYNMAESSNWLARTFNTKSAELKSMFGKAGADAPVTKEAFECIRHEGGPSLGVAVIEPAKAKAMSPSTPEPANSGTP